MIETVTHMAEEAKSYGLVVVIWSYPRGPNLSKEGQTAIDVTAYAAHIAALCGAHIIKVKPPTAQIEKADAHATYQKYAIAVNSLEERIAHIVESCFAGKRIVVFSGGESKNHDSYFTRRESH